MRPLIILAIYFISNLFFPDLFSPDFEINPIKIHNNQAMNNRLSGIFPEPNKAPYFYVPLGKDWVKINDNWSIRLDEVISDTRCPLGVVCETCGEAKVKVQFMQPDVSYYKAYFETLEVYGLNRFPMPNGEIKPTMLKPITINRKHAVSNKEIGFKITFVDLRPYPDKQNSLDLKKINYTALFLVEAIK